MQIQKRMCEDNEQRPLSPGFLESLGKWLAIFGQHYQQAIDELSVYAYQIGLQDLPVAELDKGCMRCLKECEFMPKVADIRKRATFGLPYLRDTMEPEIIAIQMYDKTMNWLRATDGLAGSAGSNLEALPPIAEYATKVAGGRSAMLSGVDADREWARKHFVENYEKTLIRLREAGIRTRDEAREALGLSGPAKLDFKQEAAGE